MRIDTLKALYKLSPPAQKEIKNAAGYAVFSNLGINILFLSTASGAGIAHDTGTSKDTYMKMISAGVGHGLGVKDFQGVFIFSNETFFNQFVTDGWQAGAQADLAAKSDGKGDAYSDAFDVAPE